MTQFAGEPASEGLSGDRLLDVAAGRGPAWLDAFLAAHLPRLIEFRRHLHSHPELSRREDATTAILGSALAAEGLAATVLPCGTGLTADLHLGPQGATGPVIVVRADLDALPLTEESGLPFASTVPGVAHACGHDVHTAVVLGAALALVAAEGSVLDPATVRVVFQPAEEVFPGGATDVVEAGLLRGVDYAYTVHCDPTLPVGTVGTRVGPITSSCDTIALSVMGPGGHTSRPQLTVNLVEALAAVATGLPAMVADQLPGEAGVVLAWGAIDAGGPQGAANVIPGRGALRGTLRIADRAAWRGAEGLVRRLIGEILAPFGAVFELDYVRGVPPTVNDSRAVDLARDAVATALGDNHLALSPQSAGAEDFAIVLDEVPGALLRLGVWDGAAPQADLHTAAFHADERAIAVGIRTLVHTVLAHAADGGRWASIRPVSGTKREDHLA